MVSKYRLGFNKTMKAYLPRPTLGNDYQSIRRNGMWYQHWQSGYSDILKKEYPRPRTQDAILAELYSPQIDDFLHGGTGAVPFLISDRALTVFQDSGFTGYRLAIVEVAKIATKGKKNSKASSGEPEDDILSRGDMKGGVSIPTLHAIYITGRVQAIPDFPSGRSPSGYVSPFSLRLNTPDVPDLFQPELNGKPFSGWSFCSDRFMSEIENAGLTNITFEVFDEFMMAFRAEDNKKQETQQGTPSDAKKRRD